MAAWDRALRADALSPLLESDNRAIAYFARRDLMARPVGGVESLWELPECKRILARQRDDGSWRYAGGDAGIRAQVYYDLLETYRIVGVLVEKHGLTRDHPAMERAARFLFSFQTAAGDFRGIYGSQYTPNYSAAITELLIKAGYGSSPRIANSMRWLRAMRQDDGGWAIPLRTRGRLLDAVALADEIVEPDRSRPSAHLVTGIVVRALAAHDRYRSSPEMKAAGDLLKSRFFKRDTYPDHVSAASWLVFSYPFWWTDLLSAMDSLTKAGFGRDDPDIARGVKWFVDHQEPGGLWQTGHNRPKDPYSDLWVALAVCRMLRTCLSGPARR